MKLKAIAFFASLTLINCGSLISSDTSYQPNINGINYGPNNSLCNTCKRGEVCTLKPGGKALLSCKPYCGDGIVVGVETGIRRCDDGNANARDGCTTCYVDNLYSCQGSPSICSKVCGNGILDLIAKQQCDDGNDIIGDGCSKVCVVNPGFSCTANDGQKSICSAICGDGKIVGDQKNSGRCDDANMIPGDGCDSTCKIQDLYLCTVPTSLKYSQCNLVCGNGKLNPGAKQACDDGNTIDGDGCSSRCQIQPGYICIGGTGALSRCRKPKL